MTTWEMNLEDAFDILEALEEEFEEHKTIAMEIDAARQALEQVEYLVSKV